MMAKTDRLNIFIEELGSSLLIDLIFLAFVTMLCVCYWICGVAGRKQLEVKFCKVVNSEVYRGRKV